MSDGIIEQDRLLALAKLEKGQKAALRRHLKKARIPYKELNGNIFTTQEALTSTVVGRGKKNKTEPRWLRDGD